MNIITNRTLYYAMTGAINLENDTFNAALMSSSYSPDKDDTTFDNTEEITGTGYTAGGKTIANISVTEDTVNDLVKWDADDVEWTSSSLTARYAVLYDTTRANLIVAVFDFQSDKISSDGTFALRWNVDGIMRFAQA